MRKRVGTLEGERDAELKLGWRNLASAEKYGVEIAARTGVA
jgi:hypothetical protein